ncbi:MAG: type II toxin-antitoxin system RelE family toxin [Phycisphaerales bacterium]
MATVRITPQAAAQVSALPFDIQLRVSQVVDRLSRWPAVSGAKPLRAGLAGRFRIRTGDYRVQFTVSGTGATAVVTITKAGHRDGFYER